MIKNNTFFLYFYIQLSGDRMRKLVIFTVILFLVGCNEKVKFIRLDDDFVSSIVVDGNLIVHEDYDYITETLSHLELVLFKNEVICNDCAIIEIVEDDVNYSYKIDELIVYLIYEDGVFVSYDIEKVLKMIEKIDEKYNNDDYFTIYYYDELDVRGSNFLDINLDNSDKILEVVSTLNIKNFNFSKIVDGNKVSLYGNDFIYKNTVIRVEKILELGVDYVISWTNHYHKHIEIKVSYNYSDSSINYEIINE